MHRMRSLALSCEAAAPFEADGPQGGRGGGGGAISCGAAGAGGAPAAARRRRRRRRIGVSRVQ